MPIYKSKGKKDGLQKYNVRINYTSGDGTAKQLTRTAYGLETAKDLERQLVEEIRKKGENSVKKITMQKLFDEYVAVKKYEIRESSLDKDKRNYILYIKQKMANTYIDKLTTPKLQEWKISIEEKGLALSTKHIAYSLFRKVLNFAVKMEYIRENPLLRVGNFKDTSAIKNEMSVYTAEQFSKFISTSRQAAEEIQLKHHDMSEWDFYVFFNIAFFTGLRKGEIHALKWSDIDGTLLHVRRSITQKLKGDDRETAPKNMSSVRTLQIPLPLIKALEEHKKRQQCLEQFTEDYRICGGERCLRDSTIYKRNEFYAKSSELNRIRIHDFRHSHVSVLANEGINIQEIARRLGHSKVEMTWNTYCHLYPREAEKAVDVLNRIV